MVKYVETFVGLREVPDEIEIEGMTNNRVRQWSVYLHIFPNKKVYVGITSRPPNKRWDI